MKQARELPIGIRVAFEEPEPYFFMGRWTSILTGVVTANDAKTGAGFSVRWDDGEEDWIDYKDAAFGYVPGLQGTKS